MAISLMGSYDTVFLRRLALIQERHDAARLNEIADSVERLQRHYSELAAQWDASALTIERLRTALQEIADDEGGYPADGVVDDMQRIARAALAEKTPEGLGPRGNDGISCPGAVGREGEPT